MNNPTPRLQEIEREIETAPAIALEFVAANETQQAAIAYYRAGLNVFALVRGTKDHHFGSYKRLQTTRLLGPDASISKDKRKAEDERAENREIFLRQFEDANAAVMCGRTSRNYTSLDCEDEVTGQRHVREFAKRDLHPWIIKTSRGFHFDWLSDVEIANDSDKDGTRHWEIRGNVVYVLMPPSVHPSGAVYEWIEHAGELPPVIERETLDWLPLKPSTTRKDKAPLPFDDNPLARTFRKTRDFCEGGAPELTRNNRLFAAACDLHARGWAYVDAVPYLWHGCEMSGFDARPSLNFTRPKCQASIDSAWGKDRKNNKPTTPAPLWVRAATWAHLYNWERLPYKDHGKTKYVSNSTARRVFLACCARLHIEGWRGEVFRGARREIAERAGVDQITATHALCALVDAKHLTDCGKDKLTGARLFAIGRNAQSTTTNKLWLSISGELCAFGVGADVFSNRTREREGLGDNARRIYNIILERPMNTAEIAGRLRCHVGTVRRALKRLKEHTLAERVGKRKWMGQKADDERLHSIARTCKTEGRGQAKREQHAYERARFVTLQMRHNQDQYEKAQEQRRGRNSHNQNTTLSRNGGTK